MNNPFRRKKPNPKRREPRRVGNGREILRGAAKSARRREIFERSGGHCEAERFVGGDGFTGIIRCNAPITLESMEWSHHRHAANKTDSLKGGIASCKECHQVGKHNPKPNPRKPGRKMNKTEAQAYLSSFKCFCGNWKMEKTAFCLQCLNVKITRQSKLDLERLENDEWLDCVADCEKQILQWRPKE